MNNISIYHQCGFRYKWNKEINDEFSIGDGFILSPLDMSKETLSDIPDEKLSSSFFDPQFYSLNLYKDKSTSLKVSSFAKIELYSARVSFASFIVLILTNAINELVTIIKAKITVIITDVIILFFMF